MALEATKVGDLPPHVTLQNVCWSISEIVSGKQFGGTKVYVPIRSRNSDSKAPLTVILETKDAQLIAALAKQGSESLVELAKLYSAISARSEVTGMIDTMVQEKVRKQLKRLLPTLTDDFVIIREGERPSPGFGIATFCVGAALLVISGARRPQPTASEPPLLSK